MAPFRKVSVGTPKVAHTSTPPGAPVAPRSVPVRCTRRHQQRRRTRCLNHATAHPFSGRRPERTGPALDIKAGRCVAPAVEAALCMSSVDTNPVLAPSAGDIKKSNISHVDNFQEPAGCPLMAWLAEELEAKGSQKSHVSKQSISPGEAWLAKGLEEKVSRLFFETGYNACDEDRALEEHDAASAAACAPWLRSESKTYNGSCRKQRKVRFNLGCTTVHEVVPYSEIYGRHPREFVFDADSRMIPAGFGGFVSLKSLCYGPKDDDEDEAEEREQHRQTEPESDNETELSF